MKRIILLTNILTPYRQYFYKLFHEYCLCMGMDFKVIVTAESEPNRNWYYDDLRTNFTILSKGKILNLRNNIFIHINPKFSSLLHKLKPDLVICAGTYLYPALWSVLWNRKRMNYKVIYWNESHDKEFRDYSHLKLKIREKLRHTILSKFDGFWYSGEWSLELIKKYCNNSAKFIFVPNLINEYSFDIFSDSSTSKKQLLRNKYNIRENKIIMICPARLTAVKGQLKFLESFKSCENRNRFTILLCGDGDEENAIRKLISTDEQWDVRLLGYKNQEEIINLYSISDFFLLPSLSDPNPLTCIEALWRKLPLIVSNHVGNSPEVISPGVNGFIFSFDENNGIVKLMNKVEICYNNKNWIFNAKAKSYSIAKKTYASKENTERIVNELKNKFLK